MKALRCFIVCILCGWITVAHGAQPRKYAVMLMDYETGKVLYSRGGDLQRYPASLTKIMTLYMVFDALESGRITLDQKFKVSHTASRQAPSKIGLPAGRYISVRNIIYALVTKSANDMAVVIAEALSGSERQFAVDMTKKARKIGMKRTVFRNASGLPHRLQVTTARDMAILGQRILRDFPKYYPMFNTKSFKYNGRTYRNHNRLLGSYKGADGIKTGYINASGFNLVASVKRGDKRLIGVVFGGATGARRNAHMEWLLDKGFRVYRHMATRPIDYDMIGKQNVSDSKRPIQNLVESVVPILQSKPPESGVREPFAKTQANNTIKALEEKQDIGDWGVQVGAYRNQKTSQKYATTTIGLIPTLKNAYVDVVALKRKNETLYLARVMGMDKSTAKTVCATVLDTTPLQCIVVNDNHR